MNIHLFSMPGEFPLGNVFAASKPYLAGQTNPFVLYLPAAEAVPDPAYIELTCTVFKGLAEVAVLDLSQKIPLVEIQAALERATVLYIPGGNTYLLLDRLNRSGGFGLIQARVRAGMPLVGFSAGMVVCGANILTSNDEKNVASTQFDGFGFTACNFLAHYPIRAYHKIYENPVLALEDDGCLEIDISGMKVVGGHCWLFEAGREKVILEPGS